MDKTERENFRLRRSGFTLIEVMGTLSVLLVIALTGASMLGKLTSIGLANKKANQARADIARLATKLREDVHSAEQMVLADRAQSINLMIGDQVIRYQVDLQSLGIVRMSIDGGERTSIDWFGLTQRCRPEFDIQDSQVTLRLTEKEARGPWIIEAVMP